MKRLVLASALLFLLAGGYYFRGSFFVTATDRDLYQYTLQSGDLSMLYRFAPLVEARMQRLIVLRDVSLISPSHDHQVVVGVDGQKAASVGIAELPGVTITFKLAPGVPLSDALVQLQDMEKQLPLPITITTSLAKARNEPRSR